MSDRPSPYDAGLGPLANSPRKLDSSRRVSLHGTPPCSGLTEIIFWRRIGEGLSIPRNRLILVLTDSMVVPGECDSLGIFRNAAYCIPIPHPIAWAEWPEGPTTDHEEDFLDSSTGMTGDERGMIG
jgi:hypothetical protein